MDNPKASNKQCSHTSSASTSRKARKASTKASPGSDSDMYIGPTSLPPPTRPQRVWPRPPNMPGVDQFSLDHGLPQKTTISPKRAREGAAAGSARTRQILATEANAVTPSIHSESEGHESEGHEWYSESESASTHEAQRAAPLAESASAVQQGQNAGSVSTKGGDLEVFELSDSESNDDDFPFAVLPRTKKHWQDFKSRVNDLVDDLYAKEEGFRCRDEKLQAARDRINNLVFERVALVSKVSDLEAKLVCVQEKLAKAKQRARK
ncbi:hypothetical protein CPC08DRAFT_808666 [Agrocybe pediades]|nr:hypothetical protein CPC08DRAFT_808666 [Agrocybe pediades]